VRHDFRVPRRLIFLGDICGEPFFTARAVASADSSANLASSIFDEPAGFSDDVTGSVTPSGPEP
jgi:hypothetical protein